MSQFTTPLMVMPLADGTWKLLEQFQFYTRNADYIITVPAGFETDFGSIPRPLWMLWPPYHPSYGKAAVIHDYLYTKQAHETGYPFTRRWADQQFLEGMRVLGANWLRRGILFGMVRLWGWIPWRWHTQRLQQEAVRKTVADLLEKKRVKK